MGKRGEIWVLVQAVLLLAVALAPHVGPDWPYAQTFRIAGIVCLIIGGIVLAWSAWNLGRSLTPFPRPVEDGRLVTDGAYRVVRHPIYFGVLIIVFGFALLTHSPLRLALTAVLLVFFDRKASREEVWLCEKYPDYDAYRRRVRRLIPWVY